MSIIMKLAFPPPPLIVLLTRLYLIPLFFFYKIFQSRQLSFWDSFLVASSC